MFRGKPLPEELAPHTAEAGGLKQAERDWPTHAWAGEHLSPWKTRERVLKLLEQIEQGESSKPVQGRERIHLSGGKLGLQSQESMKPGAG